MYKNLAKMTNSRSENFLSISATTPCLRQSVSFRYNLCCYGYLGDKKILDTLKLF